MNDKPMWIKRTGLQAIVLDEEREGYTKVVEYAALEAVETELGRLTKTIDAFMAKAKKEHELAARLVIDAGELLAIESQKNMRKTERINGVNFYPVGGNYKKNSAYYALDRTINDYKQFLKEGFNP